MEILALSDNGLEAIKIIFASISIIALFCFLHKMN